MTVPPLLAYGLAANFFGIMLGFAVMLLVLWLGRRRENILMSLFFVAVIVTSFSLLMYRLSLFFEVDRVLWVNIQGSATGTYGLLIFIFAAVFTENVTKLTKAGWGLGVLAWVVSLALLWTGNLITDHGIYDNGAMFADYSAVGLVTFAALLSFEFIALVSLVTHPTDRSKALIPGVVMLILAAVSNIIPVLAYYPTASILTMVAVVLFGRALFRFQMLNPLADANRDLSLAISEKEKLIEDLEAYAHTVAHDLKNPLTAVLGYVDLSRKTVAHSEVPEPIWKTLSVIERSSRKMNNIINELLLLASVRKLNEVSVSPVNTQALIDSVKLRLATEIDRSGATFAMPDSWPEVNSYAPWVEEVWTNYISNAIKYGGEPPHVELGWQKVQKGVQFWVRDNGNGVTEEDQAKLFKQFSRLETSRAEGHGLGLSIVLRIIEKLGGEVSIKSGVGKGSTFFFILPDQPAS